ncbi:MULTISPECIES: hypothetical protein [unclassified Microcoleus]|uniref:hypothetical protein n=1 Tax=unclassified Microcoleus TaxID=2642155 RepID=UPI002FD672F7
MNCTRCSISRTATNNLKSFSDCWLWELSGTVTVGAVELSEEGHRVQGLNSGTIFIYDINIIKQKKLL